MKLWIVHHYAIPPTDAGITRHYQLAYELQKRGHKPVIIAADIHHRSPGKHRLSAGIASKLDLSNPVPILRLKTLTASPSSLKRVINMWAFAWRLLRKTGLEDLEKPDLIIGCTPDLFSALASYRLAKNMGVPFVFHVGEIWPLMLVEIAGVPKWHPFIILLSWIERYLYKKADIVIAAQENTREHIASQGGNPSKVTYIPNGVDLDKTPQPAIKTSGDKFNVMYIGALGKANAMDAILDAAKIIKNRSIEVHIIGDGPLRTQLMQKSPENVIFYDAVPRDKIYQNMKEADAFIVNVPDKKPYRYGLAHNKVFDYMAMARPVIIATNTVPNPIVEYDAGFQTHSEDAPGMARLMEKVATLSPQERERIGQNGRRGVEEKYNFHTLGKILEESLLKIVAKN